VANDVPVAFKSGTNLVQVPVVARDSRGQIIGNLDAQDFLLFDNGKPQLISRFIVERHAAREDLQTRTQNILDPMHGEVVSGTLPDRFVTFLINDINGNDINGVGNTFLQGRLAVARYLSSLRPTDRAAAYSMSGNVALDFTNDLDRLRETLFKIGYQNRPLSSACYEVMPDSAIGAGPAHVRAEWDYNRQTADRDRSGQLTLLRDVVTKLSAMPGRRSIILVSGSLCLPEWLRETENELLAGAIRAGVVIDSVDPAPLKGAADPPSDADLVFSLTSGTGGVYVPASNDVDGALRRADAVPEYVYLLGFSPKDLKLDGKFHNLRVALKNPRGITVQARNGYYAAGYSPGPAEQVKQQVEETFFSSAEMNDLPIQIQTQFLREGDADAALSVIVKVDGSKLSFRKQDGRNSDELTLVAGIFDENGNYVQAYQKRLDMRLRDSTLETWRKSGVSMKTDFNVRPGKYLVRVVVRDAGGQLIAGRSTGVDIPW
jgi:VWFA-related protein